MKIINHNSPYFRRKSALKKIIPVIFLSMAAAVSAQAQTNGLISRYSFNDGTANDSFGTAHGSLFNGANISGGQLILGGTGTGASVQYMSMPSGVIPTNSTQVTVLGWFTSTNSGVWGRLFDFGSSTNNNFFFAPTTTTSLTNSSRLYITQTGIAGAVGPAGGPNLNDNREHMIAAVLSQPQNLIAYYLDGALVGNSTLGSNTVNGLQAFNNYIGRSQYSADPGFRGMVNELRIYNTALTAQEITTSYASGANVIPEPSALSLLAVGLGVVLRRRRRAV